MPRSEAQKRADKKYFENRKNALAQWNTTLLRTDAEAINAIIEKSGMSKAEFLRWAAKKLKQEL